MPEYTEYKPEFLYLTTIGRKTGNPHEIEIWFVEYEGCYYLCSEGREKWDWAKNIMNNPQISFWVHGQTYSGKARPVDAATEPALVKAVSDLFDAKYKWSDGLLVELRADTNPSP